MRYNVGSDGGFDFSQFRENLRALIDSTGKSDAVVAKELNMTRATLSRYWRGTREPQLEYVIAFADYFGVTVDWLLGLGNLEKNSSENKDAEDMYNLFCKATPEDRQVMTLILSRYKDKQE